MQQDLDGKVAIVTRAAGVVGFAVAQRLAGAGARVVVCDLDAAAAAAAAARLPGAVAVGCDVRNEAQVRSLVDRVVEQLGGLDVMVADAGAAVAAPIAEMDLAAWRRVTAVSLDGVFFCVRHAAAAIISSGGGSIVTVASSLSRRGSAMFAHYAAATAGVVSLTQTAAAEFRGYGLRVNTVLPGFLDTALVRTDVRHFERALGAPAGSFTALVEQRQGRLGQVAEVAEAVAFFAGDASSFCSGTSLVLDGGMDSSLY